MQFVLVFVLLLWLVPPIVVLFIGAYAMNLRHPAGVPDRRWYKDRLKRHFKESFIPIMGVVRACFYVVEFIIAVGSGPAGRIGRLRDRMLDQFLD